LFHFLANLFFLQITFCNDTPEQEIRQLRSQGLSMAQIADRTGTTVAVVRRLVEGTAAGLKAKEEEAARRIGALPLPWWEKVKLWEDETGKSGATLRRLLKK
jgi:transcriptional regulator with XRE-family HTH domain